MSLLYNIYLGIYVLRGAVVTWLFSIPARLRLSLHRAKIGRKFAVAGWLNLHIEPGSHVSIGNNVRINSGLFFRNAVGSSLRTGIWVIRGAELSIADGAGISNATIVCANSIKIGTNVYIGGGTCIYDTDFHPVRHEERNGGAPAKTSPIEIGDEVFVGGHCIILKGVRIGNGSVIGAGSVVAKDIPPNEVWAGNPVKFIKRIGG